jgi:ATP-dependent HslUV protease subunit HslV
VIKVEAFRGKTVAVFGLARSGISSARALIEVEGLEAEDIARRAMKIAADICVYTNQSLVVETL